VKLSGVDEFVNTWPQSMGILKEKILIYFQREGFSTENVWFPDIDIVYPAHLKNQNNITIVLLGGFLERIFETGNWPDKNYSFFCLSSRVKKILTEMFFFPEDAIRVIARNEIFAFSSKVTSLNLKKDIHFFYSGRLSSQKNIELIIAFYKILEEKLESNIRLSFYGEWDNNIPKSRGRYIIESFQREIESFQNKLTFKNKPHFIHGQNSEEWIKNLDSQSVLLNFSTFVCEDYGVSVAQTQSLGLPMILSDWGGHGDVIGENTLLVDTSDIAESLSPFEVIMLKGQVIVEKLLRSQLKRPINSLDNPKRVSSLGLSDLQKIRHSAIGKYGHEICLLGQDRLSLFASSSAGRVFFKQYTSIFSGK
jgi:glycosyltransferase involved in cell wall biosynthesis